ncbi:rRNA methyltransferase 3A, mitochondrial [Triplophysa rosa]|uniref:rRNA methyltransferase 3A n=1 Tax=Triplophysa rosa TaxID=992332 RepID=A0A9W7TKB6_TRIRA|nr:rRNA methyltransferase 3A, mitochondrial [Triplophysa rosa]KAI7800458.1 rRNA methyltransferase 3A [Triplophysa rosa]
MAAFMYNVSRGFILREHSLLLRGHNQFLLDSRRYVRALRRRPVTVLYPDGERETRIKSKESANKTNQTFLKQGRERTDKSDGKHTNEKMRPEVANNRTSHVNEWIKDKLGGLRYEKAPAGDKRLAHAASIGCSRAFRDKEGKVLLEGRRLICDALAAGASPQTLFFSAVERLQELPLDKLQQAKLIKVKYEDMKTWSDLVTPQGVIAIFSKPDASRLAFPKDTRLQSVPLFLICDRVRDAGNIGTILRCAAAAGCDRVLLTKGCVDAWEPKVLRAAMGAHFRLPVFSNLNWNDISKHLPLDITVQVADNRNHFTKDPVSETIPTTTENASWSEYIESDTEEESDDGLALPCVKQQVYHERWAQRSTALVIGGETHGLSLEALRLAEKTEGKILFVPMATGVESLNSAMAASILLFEGRRQLQLDKGHRKARSKLYS